MNPIFKYALLCGALALGTAAGCAVRLGGPKPETYRTLALAVDGGESAADVAARIRRAGADVVLVSSPADHAWFEELARETSLVLSGPGDAGPVRLAFLGGTAIGDTTIALPIDGGGQVVVHDALYRVDKHRYLDLMALRIGPDTDLRGAVRALLAYVATDVMHTAAVALAVEVPDAAAGDSVSMLLRPAFTDTRGCLESGGDGSADPPAPRMRLFYGPGLRIRCEGARLLDGSSSMIMGRLVVQH